MKQLNRLKHTTMLKSGKESTPDQAKVGDNQLPLLIKRNSK